MEVEVWGKSKVKGKIILLSDHINDVLKVFKYLKNKLKSEKLADLVETVIRFHDMGKVLPYFQIKTLKNRAYRPFDAYVNIPHSLFSVLLIQPDMLKKHITKIVANEEDVETYFQFVIASIAYHHWRESFYDIIEGYSYAFKELDKLINTEQKWQLIKDNLETSYNEIDGGGLGIIGLNNRWTEGLINGINFADYAIPPYQLYRMPKRVELSTSKLKDWILISGFTMLSDHFASYIENNPENNIDISKVEIEGIKFKETKERIAVELKEKIGVSYKQSDIWQFNHVEKYKEKNTVLLAPTGMGKTEFAFLWSNGEKFFYTLPLRAAVNQIYNRTAKIFFEKHHTGILHSDADIYIFGDGGETESMRVYELARQLASPAIVSTGDQFFPYALRPPAYEKIFAKFSYSRLIIDEVQAYDPKAAAIVVKFIEHVVQMGGKFLLMTATLPQFIRRELEERVGLKEENELDLFKEEQSLKDFKKHKIKVCINEFSGEPDWSNSIIQEIVEKALEGKGKRVLVILNTIKHAQFVYKQIRENVVGNKIESSNIKLFHSRYTFARRKKIEDELLDFMGNNDKSREILTPKILIATQVVEASLDLDADFMFTELAPWDSLIQRMGRVFRELRNTSKNKELKIKERYATTEIPENINIIIMDGKDKRGNLIYESGKGYVYHRELLNNTLKLLENKNIDEKSLQEFSNKDKAIELSVFNKLEAFDLSEPDKSNLVDKLYSCLPKSDKKQSKYLASFYDMLQVLDAGFMSDRKSEAQKIFREISDINTISETEKDNFIEAINDFDFEPDYAYTRFKSKIISRFVLNVQRYKVEEYLYESNEAAKVIEYEDIETIDNQKLNKLRNWLRGVYFVNLEYSDDRGLQGVNDDVSSKYI